MEAPFPSPPQSPAGPVVSQVGSLAGLFWGQSLATVPETVLAGCLCGAGLRTPGLKGCPTSRGCWDVSEVTDLQRLQPISQLPAQESDTLCAMLKPVKTHRRGSWPLGHKRWPSL